LVIAEVVFWFPLVAVLLWLAGVVLVFFGERWTSRDRMLALLVLGPGMWVLLFSMAWSYGGSCGGVGGFTDSSGRPVPSPNETVTCTTYGPPEWLPWVARAVLLAFLVAQVFVAVRLYRRAVTT